VVLMVVATLVGAIVKTRSAQATTTYSQFLQQVESGQVRSAVIAATREDANRVTYELTRGGTLQTVVVPSDYRKILDLMQQKMVDIDIRDGDLQWPRIVMNASPFLILLAVWFVMMGRLRGKLAG
ncbi:MAG TPA: ATP-dependent metallopeptidase FtsH/Yme1/Tma family protein, partial [Candidatus Acidoferrum sp.]|nr:ATP-dependent metallopeptidase FtsH/Yme1/Tma family protein [Candidatus Acidoferrum sp.]